MHQLSGLLVFFVILVVGNLAAQRLLPTKKGSNIGRRVSYGIVVRLVIGGALLAFFAL